MTSIIITATPDRGDAVRRAYTFCCYPTPQRGRGCAQLYLNATSPNIPSYPHYIPPYPAIRPAPPRTRDSRVSWHGRAAPPGNRINGIIYHAISGRF